MIDIAQGIPGPCRREGRLGQHESNGIPKQAGGVGRWNPLRSRPVNSADSAASVSDEPRLLLRAYFAAPDASVVGPACLRFNRREGRQTAINLRATRNSSTLPGREPAVYGGSRTTGGVIWKLYPKIRAVDRTRSL